VIHHDRFWRQRRTGCCLAQSGGELVGVDEDCSGDAVMWPHRVVGPTGRCRRRAIHLEHHRGSIDRLRRDRGEPQPDDAAGVPVHGRGQFDSSPPQRDWVDSEHIQACGIEDYILARSGGLQFPVGPFGSRGDIPVAGGGAREGAVLGFKPFELPVGRRLGWFWNHTVPEADFEPFRGLVDDRLLGGFRLLRVFAHDGQRCFAPPRVDPVL
jgi:hypothetical protein